MRRQLAAGGIAVLVGLIPAGIGYLRANDGIDHTTTASIRTEREAETDVRGSAAFQSALTLLVGGEAAAAYEAAKGLPDAAERRAVQWAAIYFHPGVIDAASISRFAADAPEFAPASLYRMRLEQSLVKDADVSDDELVEQLGSGEGETVAADIRLAQALLAEGDREAATALARKLWIENFLTTEQEAEVLDSLGALLDRDSHWQRAVHLMMHDRAKGSERLLPFLTPAQQSLVAARAAVSRDDADAKAKLDAVDASLAGDPVYIFSRVQRARQFKLWESAAEWLDKAPATVPDPAAWWTERQRIVRQMLDAGKPALAFRVAAGHVEGPDGGLVQARFHAGWIALAFLDDAEAAAEQFSRMTEVATLPDTIAQSHYWLARAETALGDLGAADAALGVAAQYGTVFYGQMARAELGTAGAGLRPLPAAGAGGVLFEAHSAVKAVRLLVANGQKRMAMPLLRHFGTTRETAADLLLAAELAGDIGAPQVAIAIAAVAEQQGTPLDPLGFPEDALPATARLATDPAAVFAIVRQESMFQLDAVSSSGARGLMQLMPGTAKDVAQSLDVAYSPARLVSDAGYNTLLGSTYLERQLDRYDGSLLLAAAAYNAGPGNADKWIRAYGDPRDPAVDPVIWIELIPFAETRTYVKRVLGNYLVYRERLGAGRISMLEAIRRIDAAGL